MNEKLTPELRDWIRMAVGVARGSNTGIAWAEFYTKLNAPEDESVPTGRLPGETNWQQQQREANPTEDEGNYIVWSDGRKTQIEDEELLQYIAENIQQEGE